MDALRQSCRKLLDELPRCGNLVARDLLDEVGRAAAILAEASIP